MPACRTLCDNIAIAMSQLADRVRVHSIVVSQIHPQALPNVPNGSRHIRDMVTLLRSFTALTIPWREDRSSCTSHARMLGAPL